MAKNEPPKLDGPLGVPELAAPPGLPRSVPPKVKSPSPPKPDKDAKMPGKPKDEIVEKIDEIDESASVQSWVRELLRESPFWLVSLAVHVGIFVLLATIIMAAPTKKRKRILLNVEEVELTREITPVVREENLADSQASAASAGFASTETFQNASADTPDVKVDALDVMGFKSPMKAGNAGEFDGDGTDGDLNLVGRSTTDLSGAVDQFAIETLNSIGKGSTLVILLIDESRSIVNKDLPIITARMDHYFRQIRLNLKPQHMGRGKWAVFSFGDKVTLRAPASSDLDRMKNGLASITPDTTGKEEILAAVNKALDTYAGKGFQHILIAALTDERGTDTENDKLLEGTIARLKKYRVRFFVFGREAVFCTRLKSIQIKIDEEKFTGYAECGPESPTEELWGHGGWWNIPSGFGMYALNRMVFSTEGIYFLLEPESKYDERKMYAMYAPDICDRRRYQQKMNQIPIRKLLAQTWSGETKMSLPGHWRDPADFQKGLPSAQKYRDMCEATANQLLKLSIGPPQDRRQWQRWVAHAQITAASLLIRRYLFGQYILCMREESGQFKNIPKGQEVILVTCNKQRGGRATVKELDQLKRVMEMVFQNHRNTPWEVMIRRMKGQLRLGYDLKMRPIPKHVPGRRGPPPPPPV